MQFLRHFDHGKRRGSRQLLARCRKDVARPPSMSARSVRHLGPGQSTETWEQLPDIGIGDAASGIAAGATSVAGTNPTNIWAVGAGIFRRM
jgi:hypothetical protein